VPIKSKGSGVKPKASRPSGSSPKAKAKAEPAQNPPAVDAFIKSASTTATELATIPAVDIWKKTMSQKAFDALIKPAKELLCELESWLSNPKIDSEHEGQIKTLHEEVTKEIERLSKTKEVADKCRKTTFASDVLSGSLTNDFHILASLVDTQCLQEVIKFVTEKLFGHCAASYLAFAPLRPGADNMLTMGSLLAQSCEKGPEIMQHCLSLQREYVHKIFETLRTAKNKDDILAALPDGSQCSNSLRTLTGLMIL
jgi:hypothetical protein